MTFIMRVKNDLDVIFGLDVMGHGHRMVPESRAMLVEPCSLMAEASEPFI